MSYYGREDGSGHWSEHFRQHMTNDKRLANGESASPRDWRNSTYDEITDQNPYQKQRSSENSSEDIDSTGKKRSFKRLTTRFAEKTSMQGIPYIHMSKLKTAKICWIVLTLVAIAAMTFHLYYLNNQFFGFPKTTKIELGFNNQQFPAVTICNVNSVRKSQVNRASPELARLVNLLKPSNIAPERPDGGQGQPGGGSNTGAQPGTSTTITTQTGSPTSTQPGGPVVSGPTGTPPPIPDRRKRFIQNLQQLNISQFDKKRNRQNDDRDGAKTSKNSLSEIEGLFKSLYMEVDSAVRRDIGHQIDDMLLSCSFSERNCYAENFTDYQSSDYGNCFTIQSSQFVSRTSGSTGGLTLILYSENEEYLSGVTTGYGFRLHIHDPSTMPFPKEAGVYIGSALETDISMRLVSIGRKGTPYGICETGDTFKKLYDLRYNRQSCHKLCIQSSTIETCGCYDRKSEQLYLLKNKDNLTICASQKELQCMFGIFSQFRAKRLKCQCDNPCKENNYIKTISSRQWPTDEYSRVLLEAVCESHPDKCDDTLQQFKTDRRLLSMNFLKVSIYFEDLNYESIEEYPEIEPQQFASDVGGAIGLWIGLSMLSMFEVVQLLIECCDYAGYKCRTGGRRKQKVRENRREDEPYTQKGNRDNFARQFSDVNRDSRVRGDNYSETRHDVTNVKTKRGLTRYPY